MSDNPTDVLLSPAFAVTAVHRPYTSWLVATWLVTLVASAAHE
jgi:hypothetical protein